MISLEYINLGVVGATLLLLLIYLIRFVLNYKHQYESNPLCTSAVLFCFTIVIASTFLLPLDLYLVNILKYDNGTSPEWVKNDTVSKIENGVSTAYYSLYGIISVLIFVLIPFLHFFNEESESNSSDRLHNSIKYTFGFALMAAVLMIIGFVIPMPELDPNSKINQVIDIVKTLKFEKALTLMLSVMTLIGISNISLYTAAGLFCWPIGLIMGTSSVSSSLSRLNDREVALRVKVNHLQERERSADRLTPAEREELQDALNELRDLERDEVALSGYRNTFAYKIHRLIRPFQIVVGTVFCLFSIFLLTTLIIVSIDRLVNGTHPKQGYILTKSHIFNPLEYVLQHIHEYVVIGSLPLLLITCYLVVATISGIRNLGLWFIIARVHRVRIGRTQPQALLYFCVTIMLTVLSFNAFLFSMSSNYITFGYQYYKPNGSNTTELCTLENFDKQCILTRSSVLTMRMISQLWFVGVVMYWWNWVFVAVALVSFLACLIRGKRKATHGIVSDEDEFED